MKMRYSLFVAVVLLAACLSSGALAATVSGIVYEDKNGNSQWDSGERGIPGVSVSNQKDVVQTDRQGRYIIEIEEEDILFVTKPSGYMTPLDDQNQPLFYYAYYPKGSPALRFGGFEPTGPLPASIDFPLVKAEEPDDFSFYALGDPQPRSCTEIDYMRNDILPELLQAPGRFAIALGDIAFDDLSVYGCYQEAMEQLGIPIYNVPGNHDQNYDAKDDQYALETFRRTFGPEYYSFDYGQVHFVVLDTIEYRGKNEQGRSHYQERIEPEQVAWLQNDLAFVPKNKLIVLTMHAPLFTYEESRAMENLKPLFEILEDRDRVLSLAGHMHTCERHYLGKEFGRANPNPVCQIICGAMCGSWWMGPKDERGIPIADQIDGALNGWYLIEVEGNQYRPTYKAAGKDKDFQLRISAPEDTVAKEKLSQESIVVNFFSGCEKSQVTCRIDDRAPLAMTRTLMKDPHFVRLATAPEKPFGWAGPSTTGRLWTLPFPEDLQPGLHNIVVEAKDADGRVYRAAEIIRVE